MPGAVDRSATPQRLTGAGGTDLSAAPSTPPRPAGSTTANGDGRLLSPSSTLAPSPDPSATATAGAIGSTRAANTNADTNADTNDTTSRPWRGAGVRRDQAAAPRAWNTRAGAPRSGVNYDETLAPAGLAAALRQDRAPVPAPGPASTSRPVLITAAIGLVIALATLVALLLTGVI